MLNFVDTVGEAVAGIKDGSTVMIGGFGNAGQPFELIDALMDCGAKDLTVVNNNAGQGDQGLALLIKEGRVRKMICSFPRQSDSWHFDAKYQAGRDRAGARAAGQPGRADPRRRGRDRRVLHPHRLRHHAGRGQGNPHHRRPRPGVRNPHPRRRRPHQGTQGRRQGQPRVPQDRPELRPHHGRRCQAHHRPGLRDRPHRRRWTRRTW